MPTKNASTASYRLSISQAHYYCRLPACSVVRNMEDYAKILEDAGIEVTDVHTLWLEANATKGELWTALSGLSWDSE